MLPEAFQEKIIKAREDLAVLLEARRKERQTIVFTNGCFDLIHPGHAIYLHEARQLGDILVLGLNSDDSVHRLKGASRPLHTWEERAIVLAALACVDFVTYFDEDTPEKSIEIIVPHIHCKGGDYQPEDLPEALLVQKLGGEVRILPYQKGHSTSALVKTIRHDKKL